MITNLKSKKMMLTIGRSYYWVGTDRYIKSDYDINISKNTLEIIDNHTGIPVYCVDFDVCDITLNDCRVTSESRPEPIPESELISFLR